MIIGQGIFISAFNVTNMFVSNCLSQKDNCFYQNRLPGFFIINITYFTKISVS